MKQNNKSLKQALLSNLSGYGLNPNQWKIQKTNKNTYWIQNKEIPSWYFRGITDSHSGIARWNKISLVSL